MAKSSFGHEPRFHVLDEIVVVTPGVYRGQEGIVTEVIEGAGDFVYCYRVRLRDGTSVQFFAFELALIDSIRSA